MIHVERILFIIYYIDYHWNRKSLHRNVPNNLEYRISKYNNRSLPGSFYYFQPATNIQFYFPHSLSQFQFEQPNGASASCFTAITSQFCPYVFATRGQPDKWIFAFVRPNGKNISKRIHGVPVAFVHLACHEIVPRCPVVQHEGTPMKWIKPSATSLLVLSPWLYDHDKTNNPGNLTADE